MKKTACLAILTAGFVMSAIMAAPVAARAADEPTVILLIGKERDHPPGTHEYLAECELLAKCLRQTQGIEAVVSDGWPTDPVLLARVDAIVLYTAVGGNVLFQEPARREQVEKMLKSGTGLVEIHWSTDAAPGEAGDKQLEYLGGWFSPSFSEIPVRDSEIKQVAKDHPVSRGWSDFPMKDEYYIKLKFQEAARPLFTANIDGTDYVVGWTLERPTAGRSFGTVCGHFHECFAKEPFRKAVVNGILWAAGREVPEDGAPVEVTEADLTLPPDPREKK